MTKRATEPHAVLHPELKTMVVPSSTEEYADDDVLVRAYPWLFVSVGSESVESASAAPGEKRNVRTAR